MCSSKGISPAGAFKIAYHLPSNPFRSSALVEIENRPEIENRIAIKQKNMNRDLISFSLLLTACAAAFDSAFGQFSRIEQLRQLLCAQFRHIRSHFANTPIL